MTRGSKVNVLFICTANLCRSPLAEQVMSARLPPDSGYQPLSAGVLVSAGTPMDPLAAEQSRAFNGDPRGAVSMPLLADQAADAAVILTMTMAHRQEVVTRFPRAVHSSFLLTEFSALLKSLADQGPGVEYVLGYGGAKWGNISRYRGEIPMDAKSDIPDPIGRSRRVHREVAERIVTHIDTIIEYLPFKRGRVHDS